jgi:energy-coupling factor transport system permease protein
VNQNARAWIIWIAAAAIIAMIARNPFYSLILLLVCVAAIGAEGAADAMPSRTYWLMGLAILFFSALYSALFVKLGETVLFRLPDWPLIGGPVTLEAIASGATSGLVLVTLLTVFLALNAIVPPEELVRLAPAGLQDLGVVVLIAFTFIPETGRHLRRIREAQAIRGHQMRGIRDWRPVVIPLLVGGLERAMRTAETMVARGYGATATIERSLPERAGLIAGLLAALTGWLLTFWIGWPGLVLLGMGIVIVLWIMWRSGRQAQRTTYRPGKWGTREILLVLFSLLALLIVALPWPFVDQSTLTYSPFPRFHLPGFDVLIGLALIGMVIPFLLPETVPGKGNFQRNT